MWTRLRLLLAGVRGNGVMAWLAAVIYVVGVVTAFGLRGWLHYRATGDSGLRRGRPRVGGAAWWAQLLFGAALVLGLVAPVLGATNVVEPVGALDRTAIAGTGLAFAVLGFGGVLAAQQAMGRSWRVGVDPAERTDLVTDGVFGWIRNPVFTAMIAASVGVTAMVPNVVQLVALVCLIGGVQLQVRVVEEPYLRRTHPAAYEAYRRQVGRFLPGIGRAGDGARV